MSIGKTGLSVALSGIDRGIVPYGWDAGCACTFLPLSRYGISNSFDDIMSELQFHKTRLLYIKAADIDWHEYEMEDPLYWGLDIWHFINHIQPMDLKIHLETGGFDVNDNTPSTLSKLTSITSVADAEHGYAIYEGAKYLLYKVSAKAGWTAKIPPSGWRNKIYLMPVSDDDIEVVQRAVMDNPLRFRMCMPLAAKSKTEV